MISPANIVRIWKRYMWNPGWGVAVFLFLVSGAVFLRTTHYEEWMIIKSDQIRDAMVSIKVLEEGAGSLPFFGPRAGGTTLRLGPAFYYLQSASAALFQSASPGILALPVLLFSLLLLPLFFFFVRRLFDRTWSMALTVVFSYGFLAIEYSRFSWNPNMTPFFTLLFLFAFLRLIDSDSLQESKRMRWFAVLGIAYGIASQLHFTVLLALPAFVFLFALFRWERVRNAWSPWGVGVFCALVLFLYVPVIVGDIAGGGNNVKNFFEAIGTKESTSGLVENVRLVSREFGKNFFRVASGFFGSNRAFAFLGLFLIGAGVLSSIVLFRREKDESKRDFLLATPLWGAAFFLLYIPIATSVDKPRFFLPLLFIPATFFGMIALLPVGDRRKRIVVSMSALLLALSFGSNLFLSIQWLSEIRQSTHQYVSPKKDTIVLQMKEDDRWWAWEQIRGASEYMIRDCPHENILIDYKGEAADFMHTTLYAFRLAGDDRIRRSRTYDGPSFCRYALTKSKPGGNPEDDQWDIGDLRIVVLEKRGGTFDMEKRRREIEEDEETPSKTPERWHDLTRYSGGSK